MKRFLRGVCFVLAIIILLTTPAFAAEPKSSNYFWYSSVYLWPTTGNTFQVWFEVTATGTMQELGASAIVVQRSTDTVNWESVATYYKEDYSNMICLNTGTHASYVTYTGTSGYYYRAKVTLYAKNSSGTGKMYEYTDYI